MAKAIVLKEYGKSEVLKLEDIKVQKPQENEISIKQTAIGVHFHDVYVRSGLYKTLSLPGIPGLEAAGIVEEIGKKVTNFKPGDKVGYITKNYGAYTSHRNLDHKIAIKIPKNISTELIATNFSRAITVQMLMEEVTNVKANDIILITAVTGGVGKIFSQWAKSIGALVIGSVSSKEKALLAKSYGCDYTLIYDQPDFISQIMDITDGKGVDKVFDSVGKVPFENSIKRFGVVGNLLNFEQSFGPVEPLLWSILASKSLTVSIQILFD